ncbi:MAG: hypothetical protein ACHRHE_02710, partial [Tepidisphaerales bacterium]
DRVAGGGRDTRGVIALLLPALNASKERTLRSNLSYDANKSVADAVNANAQAVHLQSGQEIAAASRRVPAMVKSFEATISLTPGLSVGTAQPESIYTAQLTSKFTAVNPTKAGECEVLLPLPPQIISLTDLTVMVNSEPSESVTIRGDKLVWWGILPAEPTRMTVTYSAVGKGLYNLQLPPSGILETFHIDLTAVGSDVRMLELSLQPTKHERGEGKTVYTWDYRRLLYGRPIALDVLGIAPIDQLGELTWLGPASVLVFGLLLGLLSRAFDMVNFDKWLLLLILGTFTGAYPLMYFAQEFIVLGNAIAISTVLVLVIIGVRSMTMMGWRIGLLGLTVPAGAILAATLAAALHPRLQGILITGTAIAVFVVAMMLIPRLQLALAVATSPRNPGQ